MLKPLLILTAALTGVLILLPSSARALPEPTIDRINFAGNLPCSEKALLNGSGLREGVSIFMVSSNQVQNAVISNLMALGYLDCSVFVDWPRWDSETYEVTILVEKGRHSLRGNLYFFGDSTFSKSELENLCPIQFGDPVTPSDTVSYRSHILSRYSALGYLRATVNINIEPFLSDSSDFRGIEVITTAGDVCYLGKITVSGLSKVRSQVVLREFNIEPGTPLNMDLMREGLASLYSLGLFSRVQVSYLGIDEGRDTIDVLLEVVEQDYIELDFASGYISPEAVFGSVWWKQPNIMGNNQKLKLGGVYTRYIASDNSGNEFEPQVVYEEPWFLSSRWDTQLKLDYYYLQRSHQEERSYGGELGFTREFSRIWRYNCGYRIERLRFRTTVEDSTEIVQDWVTSARISSSITRDTRYPLLNPVRGKWYKLAASVAGGIAGGSIDFYTVNSEFRNFFPLSDRLVLAGRAAGSVVLGYGGNTVVPPNDRLYLGGGTTVRGYDFQTLGPEDEEGNPLGGNVMALGNAEARFRLKGNLGAVLFCDAGGVWSNLDQVSTGTTGFGTGLGLRYDTPIGPVRLDYGFAPTWSNSLKRGKVYLAIGQAF